MAVSSLYSLYDVLYGYEQRITAFMYIYRYMLYKDNYKSNE